MLFKGRNNVVNFFYDDGSMILESRKTKAIKGKTPKILTPKQILQTLGIALAQPKADNISENLLTEICQLIYSLYQAKKKEYNNIINSIKL